MNLMCNISYLVARMHLHQTDAAPFAGSFAIHYAILHTLLFKHHRVSNVVSWSQGVTTSCQ